MKSTEGILRGRGKQGGAILYIQSSMISDERFPFRIGESIQITIVENTLVISHSSLGKRN